VPDDIHVTINLVCSRHNYFCIERKKR